MEMEVAVIAPNLLEHHSNMVMFEISEDKKELLETRKMVDELSPFMCCWKVSTGL